MDKTTGVITTDENPPIVIEHGVWDITDTLPVSSVGTGIGDKLPGV